MSREQIIRRFPRYTPHEDTDPVQVAEDHELQNIVQASVSSLAPKQAEAIVLRFGLDGQGEKCRVSEARLSISEAGLAISAVNGLRALRTTPRSTELLHFVFLGTDKDPLYKPELPSFETWWWKNAKRFPKDTIEDPKKVYQREVLDPIQIPSLLQKKLAGDSVFKKWFSSSGLRIRTSGDFDSMLVRYHASDYYKKELQSRPLWQDIKMTPRQLSERLKRRAGPSFMKWSRAHGNAWGTEAYAAFLSEHKKTNS